MKRRIEAQANSGGDSMSEERDSFRKTAAQFEEFARETEVPPAMRDLAERNIAQMRETYERSKDALESACRAGRNHSMRLVEVLWPLTERSSTLLSAISIQASTLQRTWPEQKTPLRPWKYSHPIGEST
jgi:hypothetical protein